MKDVPVEFPQGLGLVTFVSVKILAMPLCPITMTVWSVTGRQYRRDVQFTSPVPTGERRPDLIIRSLRGNVGTRLRNWITANTMPSFLP